MTAFVFACLLSAGCSHSRAVESKAAIGHPGDDLRARLGLTLPSSEMMVIAYGVAQHHTRSESSVVAWRSGNGVWTIERAGQESSGLLKMEPRAHPITRKTLSSENAERLEKLIAAPDVYQEQVQMGDFPVGGFASTMEIITPKRRRVVQWAGRLTGKLGQVADIVIGRG